MKDSSDLLSKLLEALTALSGWEVVAALLGVGYVVLAARESMWCWPAAFCSTVIYTVLFWEGQLPMQALLNFYYMGMAVYGFWLWRHHASKTEDLKIRSWPLINHLVYIVTASLLSVAIGWYLSTYTETRLPYLDASVMIFSVVNTWLMAQKILQNWLYWLVVDSAAIVLYWQTGYYVTILLFTIYLVLSVYGYRNWSKTYREGGDDALVKS